MFTTNVFEKKDNKNSFVITFLIGNGFDIGLGLRTQYKDFLIDYLQQPTKTDVIKKLKGCIRKDLNLWGDAELAFAQLRFSSLGSQTSLVLHECLQDFTGALSDYLKGEAARFCEPDERIKQLFGLTLCSYYQTLTYYPRQHELKRLKKFNRLNVNIINFNYTEIVDQLLPVSGTMELPDWGAVDVQFNEVCHVHGALSADNSRLFGVDNISQVEDNALSNDVKIALLKPHLDRMLGCNLQRTATEMIDDSDTVIVFGLSMGASDQQWWDYLFDHIDQEHQLCLMQYVKNARRAQSISEEALWAQQEREKFYASVSPKNIGELTSDNMPDGDIKVSIRGPYTNPDGNETFCDPFNLNWFSQKVLVNVFPEEVSPSNEDESKNIPNTMNKEIIGNKELIYKLICERPGINQKDLTFMIKSSSRSVRHILKSLKESDKIEYRDSEKVRGWFAKPKTEGRGF